MKFRKFIESGLDDLFDFTPKKVIKKEEQVKQITIPLYRGFSGNLSNIKMEGDYYILSPEKAEQGMLWFTHPYINYYNPIEYAKNHGDWFMSHKLSVKKHIEIEHHEDGSTYEGIPQYFRQLAKPTENNKYYAGIELPDGWVFSYKTEKFIGCTIKIKIHKDMVVKSESITI